MRQVRTWAVRWLAAVTISATAIGAPVLHGATYHVDDDTCPAAGDGSPGNPFCSIQAGIDAATAGDTVLVAAGTYQENIVMQSGVVIQGAGRDVTVIDGGGTGPVVTAIDVDSTAELDGFTVTNGFATYGGGMYNSNASPQVSNCTFSSNVAELIVSIGDGGGMYNVDASPTVNNCSFEGNAAANQGGGMYNFRSSPQVTDCMFSENTALFGGGMLNDDSSPAISDSTFDANTTLPPGSGAGMVNDNSSPTVSGCAFIDNVTAGDGGGMLNHQGSAPLVVNCIFSGNFCGESHGGHDVSNIGTSITPVIVNTTIYSPGGWSVYNWIASPTITNCILSGHFDMIRNEGGASPTVTYSNVPYSGTGNIFVDPLFVDASEGDFHLRPSSPCIDAGDNTHPALPASDMDGDDRTIDDPAVPDTGNGAPPIVDMGADEFDPSKPLFGDGFETGECDRWSAMVTGAAAGHTCGTPFHVTDDLLPVELVGTFDDDPAVGGSCDTTPNNVVWFTYTPDTTDIYRIDLTNGSSTNAYSRVAVFETTSCSPYGTELTCVTATSKSISAEVTLTADATYLIPFYTDGEVYTMVDPLLEIEAIGPDPGTACTNPYDVTGATFPVQLTGTFDDDPAVGGSCDATPTNVVWFSYTPDATDIYRIDLVNNSDTNAYSRVAVFESTSCSPYGTELTCVTATSKSISAEVTLTAGTSYLIPFFTDGDVYTMIDPEITITAPP